MVGRIAIIPARGGSKRLPRKNILDFHGRPLLGWTVAAALESGAFDRVLVSTDDPEIAQVAVAVGAEAPFLRDTAADDMSDVSSATLRALVQSEAHWTKEFDIVCQLMPNCPLRDAEDIKAALERFEQVDTPTQLSCFRYGWMNPWWAATLDNAGHTTPIFPDALKQRSQDLPSLYCPTGAIWLARGAVLKAHRSFYAPGYTFHPMGWLSAMDIDDAEDLEMARVCFELKQRNRRN